MEISGCYKDFLEQLKLVELCIAKLDHELLKVIVDQPFALFIESDCADQVLPLFLNHFLKDLICHFVVGGALEDTHAGFGPIVSAVDLGLQLKVKGSDGQR